MNGITIFRPTHRINIGIPAVCKPRIVHVMQDLWFCCMPEQVIGRYGRSPMEAYERWSEARKAGAV
jgi:hypothetical protein